MAITFGEALRRASLGTDYEVPLIAAIRAEAAVLSESSLNALAMEIVKSAHSPVVFLMYLNIPTGIIINYASEMSEVGIKDADKVVLLEFTKRALNYWKKLKATAREKDKVNDIERALKEMGSPEIADVFRERHQQSVEITNADFS